jgi:hypothetical protein
MRHWNHRILRTEFGYAIHEVFYEDGKPTAWDPSPSAPFGEDHQELAADLVLIAQAIGRPILRVDGDSLIGEES